MATEQFINIDGDINKTTPWTSEAHGVLYPDLGYSNGYHLSYTRIKREIPKIIGYAGPLTDEQYWKSAPRMYAKLCIHRVFRTKLLYYTPRFMVYHNGVPLDDCLITHPGYGRFEIDPRVPDGYLWVTYIPASPALCVGDKRAEIDDKKVISEFIAPLIAIEHITRCRRAILNLQFHTGYIPSNWIGGPYNTVKSRATNIIKTVTPLYSQHIAEMQTALNNLADHIDSLSAYTVPNPVFTGVVDTAPYSVHYIEEIRLAINDLEYYAIDLVT